MTLKNSHSFVGNSLTCEQCGLLLRSVQSQKLAEKMPDPYECLGPVAWFKDPYRREEFLIARALGHV
jgi:hypothetical protein